MSMDALRVPSTCYLAILTALVHPGYATGQTMFHVLVFNPKPVLRRNASGSHTYFVVRLTQLPHLRLP